MYTVERHFVKTAHERMQFLDMSSENAGLHEVDLRPVLSAITEAARPAQARAVMRAAKICQDVIQRTHTKDTSELGVSLLSLRRLIDLYSEGLFEIDPEFKLQLLGRTAPDLAPEISDIKPQTSVIIAPEAHTENTDLETVYLEGRHAAGVALLKPLLRLVSDNENLQALETLMQTTAIIGDETQETRLATGTGTGAGAALLELAHTVKFENLMRPITNLILGEARHAHKSVSVSYAADFDDIGADIANHVQDFLEVVCLNIVANGVADTSTQISLTGQERERQYRFSINWSGKNIAHHADMHTSFRKAIAGLRAVGGDIKFRNLALQAEISTHEKTGEGLQSLEISFPQVLSTQAAPAKPKKDTPSVSNELMSDNLAKVGGISR